MGGGTTIEAPQQTSSAEAIQEWVSSLPTIYETQLEYAPKEAAQQVEIAQQYAGQLGEAYLAAQKAMYPEEYALKDELMQQAREGMSSGMPSWMRQQYQSDYSANLGTNIGSPVGADYTSRGLLQQEQDWKKYYQNMAMSLSGSQPIYQAQSPSYTNYMSNFTPSTVLGYASNQNATAANIFNTQQQAATSAYGSNMNLLGSLIGAGGQMGAAALLSSRRYKRNISLWE